MRRRQGVVQTPNQQEEPANETGPIEQDQHFSVPQVAQMWGIHVSTVRRIFWNMHGVIKLGSKHKTLFIPSRVLKAIHQALSA